MSVLDLDFYKLTMLQFIWKHYDDVPVTFRLHSRKQGLAGLFDPEALRQHCTDYFYEGLTIHESMYLRSLGVFDDAFIRDLERLFNQGLVTPQINHDGVVASGDWFEVSLWETVILSAVSEQYSRQHVKVPSIVETFGGIRDIGQSGAKWADFGTRRRFTHQWHDSLVDLLSSEHEESGFIGTSNVDMARRHGVKPIGTYAHELEMVLRTVHDCEFDTTRDVLTKWGDMYPRDLRIALTDTYTTPYFLEDHGKFLLDNDWRGVRLDSGSPLYMGWKVTDWLDNHGASWDVIFSDGLSAEAIVSLQRGFGSGKCSINPAFGWGTGLTNPNSDLSLVMKATEANGQQTYKITDDETKAIR